MCCIQKPKKKFACIPVATFKFKLHPRCSLSSQSLGSAYIETALLSTVSGFCLSHLFESLSRLKKGGKHEQDELHVHVPKAIENAFCI